MVPFPNQVIPGRIGRLLMVGALVLLTLTCSPGPEYDLVIRGGTLYDGSGGPGVVGDLDAEMIRWESELERNLRGFLK